MDGNFEYDGSYGIVGTGLFLTQARKHARLSDLIRAGTYVFLYLFFFFFSSYLFLDYLDLSCALVHKLWDTHLLHRVPTQRHRLLLIIASDLLMYPRDHFHHLRLSRLRSEQAKNTDNTMPTTPATTQMRPDLTQLRVGYLMDPDPDPVHLNPYLGRLWQVPQAV